MNAQVIEVSVVSDAQINLQGVETLLHFRIFLDRLEYLDASIVQKPGTDLARQVKNKMLCYLFRRINFHNIFVSIIQILWQSDHFIA